MLPSNAQLLFFQHVKAHLPPHLSMVDEVADLLNISNDSAYRRIRGEKTIDLEEIQKMCIHFKISMDKLLHLQSDAFIFTGLLHDASDTVFEDWMETIYNQLTAINSFKKKHIYFLMKDIPPFVHFHIPELASFKFFFWMKSILHYESLKGVKFDVEDNRYKKFHARSKKIIELYSQVPSTEIWNIENINSSLRQIEFYHEAGAFANPADAKMLYLKMEDLINHIELQAELGTKFSIGQQPHSNSAPYRLFINELILGDNTIVIDGDVRATYLNHSVIHFLGTQDEKFNNSMFANLENLMKKSTLISGVGEKDRKKFFNRIRQNILTRLDSLP